MVLNPPANATRPVDAYIVTLCPTSGGACINATCPTSHCPVGGLQLGTTYDVTAVAIINGVPTPPSNSEEMTTPRSDAPALTGADDTGPTTATASATPPPNTAYTSVGGVAHACCLPVPMLPCWPSRLRWDRDLKLACRTGRATTRHRRWTGCQLPATRAPHPGTDLVLPAVSLPKPGLPSLPARAATLCLQYTFTATPLNGGPPVVVTSSTPEANFTGLEPATQYEVTTTATRPDGTTTPASNPITFVTPAEK